MVLFWDVVECGFDVLFVFGLGGLVVGWVGDLCIHGWVFFWGLVG